MIQKGKRGIYGETSPGCGGPRIQITPEVFVNEEQVARTLYHENVHARQIIENGGRSHQTVGGRQRWEEEAYTAEDVWWTIIRSTASRGRRDSDHPACVLCRLGESVRRCL